MLRSIKKVIPFWLRKEIKDGIDQVRKIKYKGNEVHCPCCGSSFSKFGPFGSKTRYNVRCWNCQSLERHRLLWLYLKQETNLFTSTLKLLHFAPEKAYYKRLNQLANIDYHPIDLFPEKFPFPVPKGDITQLKFPNAYFDVIIANNVIQEVPDDRKAMQELVRVLKKDGYAILLVPLNEALDQTYEDLTITDPQERAKAFGWGYDDVRIYGKDYVEKLEQEGFNVKVVDFYATLSEQDRRRYALDKSEKLFYCTKKGS